jgi:hypothetical protein
MRLGAHTHAPDVDREHGTWRQADDFVGHASHQKMSEAAATVCDVQDPEVCAKPSGELATVVEGSL